MHRRVGFGICACAASIFGVSVETNQEIVAWNAIRRIRQLFHTVICSSAVSIGKCENCFLDRHNVYNVESTM